MKGNDTWFLMKFPKGKKPFSCKWVYRIKYRIGGSMERCKARLVIRGFTQKASIEYTEDFSPVVKIIIVRCLIVVAMKKNWPLFQLEVNNAFLHGDLHEEIYMKVPQGLITKNSNYVCKLQKSLYVLKQVSRQRFPSFQNP